MRRKINQWCCVTVLSRSSERSLSLIVTGERGSSTAWMRTRAGCWECSTSQAWVWLDIASRYPSFPGNRMRTVSSPRSSTRIATPTSKWRPTVHSCVCHPVGAMRSRNGRHCVIWPVGQNMRIKSGSTYREGYRDGVCCAPLTSRWRGGAAEGNSRGGHGRETGRRWRVGSREKWLYFSYTLAPAPAEEREESKQVELRVIIAP